MVLPSVVSSIWSIGTTGRMCGGRPLRWWSSGLIGDDVAGGPVIMTVVSSVSGGTVFSSGLRLSGSSRIIVDVKWSRGSPCVIRRTMRSAGSRRSGRSR